MISKNQGKHLRALQRKKARRETQQFLVEGEKSVLELLESSWPLVELFATEAFIAKYQQQLAQLQVPLTLASREDLTRFSSLANNHSALAVARQVQHRDLTLQAGEWALAVDQVQDPGNLGSLLRIADWYGFSKIFCAPATAELYNPKVIAASKGSFLRVKVCYRPLPQLLAELPALTECWGAFLEGENLHQVQLGADTHGGLLVVGSESQGISSEVAAQITKRVTIPAFGQAESLNVGVATAVICDTIKRLTTASA